MSQVMTDLRYIGSPPFLFHHFAKGNNCLDFLFAFSENAALQKWVLLLKKEFAPRGANSFL